MPQIVTKGKAIAGQFSLLSGVMWISGSGAPVDGTTGTGAGVSEKGSFYVRVSNGAHYYNTGTKASPTWTLVGTISSDTVTSAMMTETMLKYAEVSIPSADIVSAVAGKLSHAQGQILLAAPGAGKIIELASATLIYDYAGAGYGGGGNLTINWGAGGAALTGLVSAANSLGSTSDKTVTFVPLATAAIPMVVNAGLSLVSSSVPWTLGSATGVVRMKVAYRVHTTGL